MALEFLKGVSEIGGFKVRFTEEDHKDDHYIVIDSPSSVILFQVQNGPIKEVGVNGCQVQTLIEAAALIIERADQKFPNLWNKQTLRHLRQAIECQKQRTRDREERGVEGLSKE